jgi:hypothetical protein
MRARGRIPKTRRMTHLEVAFGEHLRFIVGPVWQGYEAITLKLAHDTRYTPDFFAIMPDGELRCYEVKGAFAREDSIIKLRVAASMFPFKFILVRREGDRWIEREVSP